MEKGNFIEIDKVVSQINDTLERHNGLVSKSVNLYEEWGKAFKNMNPSDVTKAYNEATKAMEDTTKSAQNVVTAKQRETLENAKLVESLNNLSKQYKAESGSLSALIKQNSQYQTQLKQVRAEIARKTKEQTSLANGTVKFDKALAEMVVTEKQLTQAYSENTREINRQVKEMNAADGSMEQMSQTLNRLRNLYSGLSADQRSSSFGKSLQSDIKNLDSELKKLDSGIGRYQRNVGNYAGQWDGLRHETNQLIRELPAMAYGANVFFGAISNNLPMFIDQVKLARQQQKLAIAEGKEAPSVMKRITAALFNWQTAIVLGLTYLTLHGREVWNWVQSLWGASEALEEIRKRQEEFNNAQLEGRKSAQAEIIELRKNLAVIKDKNVADDLRVTAIKQLRQQYPRYFKDLTDEELLTWKAGQAIQSLTEALEKRKEVEQKTDLNVLNRQRLIQLESEIEAVDSLISENEELSQNQLKLSTTTEGLNVYEQRLNSAYSDKEKLLTEQAEIQKDLISNEEDIIRLRKETIALEWQDEKATKDKTKANYDYISSLESEYELMKLIYEQSINRNQQIADDETKSYDKRAKAILQMYEYEKELNELNYNESIRLAEKQNKEEEAILKKAYEDNIISTEVYYAQLQEIAQKFRNESTIIEQNYWEEKERIDDEAAKGIDKQIKKLWEYNQALLDVSRVEQNRLFANTNELEGLNFNNVLKEYERVQKERTNIAEEAEKERLNLQISSIDEEMAKLAMSSDEYQDLANEKIQAENRLEQIRQRNADAEAQRIRKLAQDYKNLMQGFQNEVLNTFPAIQKLISEDFQKLIDDLMAEGEFGKAAMAIGLQVSEAFQQMYNMMQTYSDAYYNQQYERLEMQRDVAIKFAGESAVAREEVERVYDEKKRRIERDQAKRQKEMAVFNAVINTAQAIVAALANPGGPAGVALAAIVGVLGAAQIAMISAQPLPAFAEGGIHSGGMMLVNDAKGSKYQETVVTPDGKIHKPKGRNVVMNAPKGTEIFTPDQWNKQLAGILLSNNILPPKQERGITKEDLKEVFANQSANGNNGVDVKVDKHGFEVMLKKGGQKIKPLNSRFRIKNLNN